MKPEQAYRTGRLAHLRRTVFAQVFNVPIEDEQACVFVELGVIDQLQSMTAPAASCSRRAAFGASSLRGWRTFLFAASGVDTFAPAALRASLASRGKPWGLSPPHRLGAPEYRRPGCAGSARQHPQQIHDALRVFVLILLSIRF